MGNKVTIDDLKSMLRGEYLKPVMHVRDEQDPLYKSIRHIVKAVDPDIEDYMRNINARFSRMLEGMGTMETQDINRIVNTFKKYEVKGTSNGIRGKRTYGYDKSRIDRALIRRKRGN